MSLAQADRNEAVRYYLRFWRNRKGAAVLGTVLAVLQAMVIVPIPLLIRDAVETAMPDGDVRLLVLLGTGAVVLYVVAGLLTLWMHRVVLDLVKDVVYRMREAVLARLYAFSRGYLVSADRKELHATIVIDSERVDVMSYSIVAHVLPNLIVGAALMLILVYIDWILFLILIAALPFIVLINRFVHRRFRSLVTDFRRSFERFSTGMQFVLESMDLTRVQAAESYEMERQLAHLDGLRRTSMLQAFYHRAYGVSQHTSLAVLAIAVLIVGGVGVINGTSSLGDLMSFFVALGLLKTTLGNLFTVIPSVMVGQESLQALVGLLQTEDEKVYEGTRRIEFRGEVALEGVHFAYDREPILAGLSLEMPPGSVTAVVGANGAGKSTIAHLILGLHRPQKGRVLADGVPYDEIDTRELRRSIGVVMQEPMLFSGTVWDNVTYGVPDADEETVREACRTSTALDFIEQLPDGFDTVVGEMGLALSGGQRQRIAIARAMLRNPRLLILDEPTNHLDRLTVGRFLTNLTLIRHAPTILLISHDASVTDFAERVVVLESGRLTRRRQPAAASEAPSS